MEVSPLVQVLPQARPPVLALLPEWVPLQAEVRPRAPARPVEVPLQAPVLVWLPAEVPLQGPALVRLPVEVRVRPPVEVRVRPQAAVQPQGPAQAPRRSAAAEVRSRPFVHRAGRPQ
jgi:hypothetical protein